MFLTLTELEHHPILFDVAYAPGEVQLSEEITQLTPLAVDGQAELLRNTLGEIRLTGHARVGIQVACDRCLEPAGFTLDEKFDLFYRPVIKEETHGEIHLEEGEVEISFYEGDGVALRDVMREFILLSLPMRIFCREDCQGLCPVCGRNRNTETCNCKIEKLDPRLAALKDLA